MSLSNHEKNWLRFFGFCLLAIAGIFIGSFFESWLGTQLNGQYMAELANGVNTAPVRYSWVPPLVALIIRIGFALPLLSELFEFVVKFFSSKIDSLEDDESEED